MTDVNALVGKRIFPVSLLTKLITALLSAYLVLLAALFSIRFETDARFYVAACIGVNAFLLLLMMQILILRLARTLTTFVGKKFSAGAAVLIVIQTIPYFLSLPILQKRVNSLIGGMRRSPATESSMFSPSS